MPNDFIAALFAAILTITGGATATEQAERGEQTQLIASPTAAIEYAPEGLDDCDEMEWYRIDAGLPATFDRIGWRESNCKNYVTSSTGCCRGWLQLDVNLHLRDHRIGPRYRDNCDVHQISDVFGDTPEQKRKHMCAARQLHDVMGTQPWSATR